MRFAITLGILPNPLLSGNERRRGNPFAQRNLTLSEGSKFVGLVLEQYNRSQLPRFTRCTLTWTLTYPVHRKRDYDNIYPSLKVFQDSLVTLGILEADDTDHIVESPVIRVLVEKGKEETRLDIQEA